MAALSAGKSFHSGLSNCGVSEVVESFSSALFAATSPSLVSTTVAARDLPVSFSLKLQ